MIKRSGAYFKNINCPFIVKQQGNNLIFQELINPNPETVTINLLATGFSTITGFKDSTACMCARQDSSWIGGGVDTTHFVNTSNATTHTLSLTPSPTGGSIQLIEGANVTLTTGGTALDGTVTIAATSGSGTDLSYSGATSPVTLNSSTGTDVTVTAGTGISLAATGTDLTITNTGDLSATNEAWTIDGDDADTELITTQTVKFQGGGINVTDYIPGTDILTITGTEVDGSITNELQEFVNGSSATTHTVNLTDGGGTFTIAEGTGIGIATTGTIPDGIATITNTGDLSDANEGILGVAAGGANDALLTSNTTGATGVTYAGAGIVAVSESTSANGGTITITGTEVDGSVTNEAWTVDADAGDTEVISNQTLLVAGGGIVSTSYNAAGNTLTVTGTEVDGSTTNEIETFSSTNDATSHTVTLAPGTTSVQLIEGSNVTLTTGGTAANATVTIASTASGGTNYQTLRDDGVDMTQRAAANFESTSDIAFTLVDDAGNGETEINADIPLGAVDLDEIQNISTSKVLGNSTVAPGPPIELTPTGGLEINSTNLQVATNGITDGMLRQSAGLSVIGRSANSTGNVADIVAASDGQVLRRSGTSLGFGSLDLTSTGTLSTLTPTQVVYGGAGGQVAQSANLTFSGTNLALGGVTAVSMIETPSSSTNSTLKIGKAEVQSFTGGDANVLYTSNAYFNAAWTRRAAGYSAALQMYNGTFLFNTSETSSTAGSTYTPRTIMTGSTAGYVNVGNIAAGTITSPLGVRGFGATSSTGTLHIQNSTPATILYCRDDQTVGIRTNTPLYALDVTSSSTASQLHFSGTGADNGGYLVSAGASNFFMAAGASWNGSNWIAKATSASIIGGGATAGQLTFYTNTGLTIGNTFAVTERAKIDEDGDFSVGVSTAAARVHSKGAGSTSATYSGLFENSSGTRALTIRDDTKVGVATATPNRTLEVSGEVRITDLTTDAPTRIVGADAEGDLDDVALTDELAITSGTLGTNFSTTISPATLTTVTNNWNPTGLSTAWIIELSGNGTFVMLTGITAPTFNKRLILYNEGDNSILLPREMTTSTAGNRFAFEAVLFPGKQVEIRYSLDKSRWLLVSKDGLHDDVQHLYANHLFQSPVSITTADFDFWEILSEAAASLVAPTSGVWSGISVNTGTDAGGLGYVSSKEPFFQTDNSTGTVTWAYCKAVIRTPSSLSDGTQDYAIRVGFNFANGGGGTTDGMYFQYNHSLVSGNWGTATTNGGSTQLNNSAVTVTTSTVYVLEMYVRPSLLVDFFINGVHVATNDTFVSTGDDMYVVAEIEKSIGTTQRDLQIFTLQGSAAVVNQP